MFVQKRGDRQSPSPGPQLQLYYLTVYSLGPVESPAFNLSNVNTDITLRVLKMTLCDLP